MAKQKRPVTKTRSRPAKPIPAMYPPPAPIELPPQKIVAIDLKTKTITIEGSPPPDLVAAAEMERRRLNLVERLTGYTKTLAMRITPHWGERPKHISLATWRNLEQRINAMDRLPENAPAPAQDDLLALQTLNRLVKELVNASDWPESIDRAICEAIDLGKLLQRGQTQIDHGKAVWTAHKIQEPLATGRQLAIEKRATDKDQRAELIRTEVATILRGSPVPMKSTSARRALARKSHFSDGTPMVCLRTINEAFTRKGKSKKG